MCDNCPRKCNVDRVNGTLGYCKMSSDMAVAKIMMHKWEEPFISGIEYGAKGTGAIFFYGCNLSCIYCQNYKISNAYKNNNVEDILYESSERAGKYIIYTPDELSDEMLKLQNDGAYTISLITANIYIDKVVEAIRLAKEKGVSIPFVYNTSGYDSIESLKKLDGLIDIYMPDFKYFDDDIAYRYSDVKDYVEVTKQAIDEMYHQVTAQSQSDVVGDTADASRKKLPIRHYDLPEHVGDALYASRKKLLIRHLVLPGHIEDSKRILKYLYDTYGDSIYISIMNQYTHPKNLVEKARFLAKNRLSTDDLSNLSRHLTKSEYDEVVDYAIDIGITNAFTQEEGTDDESFIPGFV